MIELAFENFAYIWLAFFKWKGRIFDAVGRLNPLNYLNQLNKNLP